LDLYQVEVKAEIPYDHTPIPGVKFTVIEYESTGQLLSSAPTGWQLEAVTDADGYAKVSFTKKKKETSKYYYYAHFDYSSVECPYPNYSIINSPSFIVVNPNEQNSVYLRVLPYASVNWKVENINCYDSQDKMRFKAYNYDERPTDDFQYLAYGSYFLGCGIQTQGMVDNIVSGHQVYQIEVTRNGIINTYIDTFFLQPGVMNDVFLEY